MTPFLRPLAAALLLTFAFPCLHAQTDTDTEYKRLQDGYTQRMNDIEGRFKAAERELLHAYILSLVRTEQSYRDAGNLDGLVLTRELREKLLNNPVFPEVEDRFPGDLKTMTQTLLQQREETRRGNQKELDDLNGLLFNALERFQRDFTRAGEFEKAIEIRDMRNMLKASLPDTTAAPTLPAGPAVIPTDPNVYPLCVEASGYAAANGVTPRAPQIPFQLSIDNPEFVRIDPKGFHLRGGQIRVPAEAVNVLIQQVQQNQMLNLEIGLHSTQGNQGSPEAPSPLMIYGTSLADCNVALTQEGRDLVLYLRTTMLPTGKTHHRVILGPVQGGRAHYIQVTYRGGELTVYRNGSETQKIRSSINGLLSNWVSAPLIMGALPVPSPDIPPLQWNGLLIQLYMKSTLDSSRGADVNFNRFSTFLSR